jgi:hypothetical protein
MSYQSLSDWPEQSDRVLLEAERYPGNIESTSDFQCFSVRLLRNAASGNGSIEIAGRLQ